MQTFLPYPDFHRSAVVLDTRRLGKQRVECVQLINAIEGRSTGWRNHPAAIMWQNNVGALRQYYNVVCGEWILRGYVQTMTFYSYDPNPTMPTWLGDDAFHAAHRSNLLRKDPEHYGQFGWTEPPTLPYIWPV